MRRSLTLLELLIVIFLLAALAASSVSLVGDFDSESRLEITKARRLQVREAILGRDLQVAGQPIVSGFVADMGRLPLSLEELLVAPPAGAGSNTHAWNSDYAASAGWRGPYLRGDWESGQPSFRDGWNTSLEAQEASEALASGSNFGWQLLLDDTPNSSFPFLPPAFSFLDLVGLGRDGAPGGTQVADLDMPYPATDATPESALVSADDWSLDLQGQQAVVLELTNHVSSTSSLGLTQLRLRVVVPRFVRGSDPDWAVGADWPIQTAAERYELRGDVSDLASLVSGSSPLPADGVTPAVCSFAFPALTSPTPPGRRVPVGTWALAIVNDAGDRVGPVDALGAPLHLSVTITPRSSTINFPPSGSALRVRTP